MSRKTKQTKPYEKTRHPDCSKWGKWKFVAGLTKWLGLRKGCKVRGLTKLLKWKKIAKRGKGARNRSKIIVDNLKGGGSKEGRKRESIFLGQVPGDGIWQETYRCIKKTGRKAPKEPLENTVWTWIKLQNRIQGGLKFNLTSGPLAEVVETLVQNARGKREKEGLGFKRKGLLASNNQFYLFYSELWQ